MKNTIKFISIGMVMVLLLMSQWSVNKSVEAADVAADDIEWMDSTDTVVTHYAPGTGTGVTAAVFYINDSDLGVTQTGTSTWSVTGTIAANSVMNLATGVDDGAAVTGATFALGDADYATGTTVNGVIDRGSLYFMLGTGDLASTGANRTAGTVTLTPGASITSSNSLVAHYTFKAADTYAVATHRAKVTSTSDSTGEWIQVTEVDDEGSTTASVDAGIFRGAVNIGVDASHATAADGAVWVQDGDTLTVTYYNAIDSSGNDGAAIASTTSTIDASNPEIVITSPSDETLTNETGPTLTFSISDGGSGFSSTITDYDDHIAVTINSCAVGDNELTLVSHSASAMSFSYTPGIGTVFSDAAVDSSAADNTDCSSGNARVSGGFNVNSTSGPAADGTTRTNDGTEFSWSVTALDLAGNSKATTATDMNVTIDSEAPAAASVTAAKAWDATDSADTDDNSSIKIAFTESLDSSTVAASDFIVSGTGVTDGSISNVTVAGSDATTDMYVYLDLAADLAPNATPKVVLSGSVTDVAGNELKPTTAETDSDNGGKLMGQATDGVKPTLSAVTRDVALLDDGDEAAFTFASDENMTLSSGTLGSSDACTCGSVTGPGTTATTTVLAASLTGVQAGSATFKESANSTDGVYGIVFLGRDASGNIGTVGSTKVTNEDVGTAYTVSGTTTTITLDNWPLADHDGDGTVADSITAATDDGTAVTFTVTNASGTGSTESVIATASSAITAGSTLKITYYYVSAEQLVEIDEAAPSATASGAYDPADGSSTTDATPSFSVTYDEDEFPGDANTTVTLSSATLDHPDGTVEDILASMTSSDDKSFYYKPGSDLPLGEYTIKTKAEDANGNESSETSAKITIEDRSDTSITMVPGWNLISLPGEPSDSDINAVITNAQVQTVLTYDPNVPGGWLTAVRDGDSLVGTLSTIDGSHAYWVQQNNNDAIKVDIPGFSGGVAAVPPAISLVAGWNLVPAINNSSDTAMDADDYFTGLDWARAKGWNANTEAWNDILPDTDNSAIAKTNGYWIYLNKAGTLVP